jgi:hypothetical protein
VRDFHSTETGGSEKPGPGNQAFVAAVTGAAALSVVMALILLTTRQAPRAVIGRTAPNGNGRASSQVDTRNLEIDHYTARAKIGPLGSRELIVEGYMTNAGSLAIVAADLRCYFRADSENQTHFDFPLVVDSSLDNLSDGPLLPQAGRSFSVRSGEFPDGFASGIARIEVVNVRLEKG